VIATLGLVLWAIWAYLLAVVIVRAVAWAFVRQTPTGAHRLRRLSDALTPAVLRGMIDAALAVSLFERRRTPGGPRSGCGESRRRGRGASTRLPARPIRRAVHREVRRHPVGHRPALPGIGTRYRRVFDANEGRREPDGARLSDPDLILPGWKLRIPGQEARTTCAVQPGDSLWEIAEHELGDGHCWREIYDLNKGRGFARGDRPCASSTCPLFSGLLRRGPRSRAPNP
jgi:hypothetical protein